MLWHILWVNASTQHSNVLCCFCASVPALTGMNEQSYHWRIAFGLNTDTHRLKSERCVSNARLLPRSVKHTLHVHDWDLDPIQLRIYDCSLMIFMQPDWAGAVLLRRIRGNCSGCVKLIKTQGCKCCQSHILSVFYNRKRRTAFGSNSYRQKSKGRVSEN